MKFGLQTDGQTVSRRQMTSDLWILASPPDTLVFEKRMISPKNLFICSRKKFMRNRVIIIIDHRAPNNHRGIPSI